MEKIKSGRRYDLILMDIQMPVMDGIEATRRIRTLETERHLPRSLIMALSAHAMTNDENKSLAAGCDGHINKPIRKKRLMEVIDRIGGMKGE